MATPHDGSGGKIESIHKGGEKIHGLAGGWITERVGTPIPVFLKISYVGFCLFGLIYLYRYRLGEIDHATRGPLVQQLNQAAAQPPAAWILFVAVVLFAFIAGLLAFAFRSREDE
jgi:hypothetical protein